MKKEQNNLPKATTEIVNENDENYIDEPVLATRLL